MRLVASGDLYALLDRQAGVLARSQAVRAGLPPSLIENQLRCGRWQRLQHGVYATFTGSPGREAVLWSAILRAGPQSALSHRTAAEVHGLADEQTRLLHLCLPSHQRVAPFSGAILHHSRRFYAAVQPGSAPPRTRVEDTVLDLTQSCDSFEDAFNWVCRAVGRNLSNADRLRAAIAARTRLRWRTDLLLALDDVAVGVRSPLERRYTASVERPHGLPAAERQVHTIIDGRSRYVDNLYRQALLAVELDGRAAHPAEFRWSDRHRDNAHATLGLLTLRYNWSDITGRPCAVAAEVAALLKLRGQAVRLRPCGPACAASPVSGQR